MSETYKTLATMTAHYNGRPYRLERVQLNDLHDWLQSHGLRVYINYNPWDRATRREPVSTMQALADMVAAMDVDGIFLDTLARRKNAPAFGGAPGGPRGPGGRPGLRAVGRQASARGGGMASSRPRNGRTHVALG